MFDYIQPFTMIPPARGNFGPDDQEGYDAAVTTFAAQKSAFYMAQVQTCLLTASTCKSFYQNLR